jgi:hypothetical protein
MASFKLHLYLTRRFFRLPQGVALNLVAGLGSDGPQRFIPLGERAGEFDREAEIADKGLTGRAAIYHPATHELFVNLHTVRVARPHRSLQIDTYARN